VAAGSGLTTVPPSLLPVVPPGVQAVTVRGRSSERRRVMLAWLPGRLTKPARRLADALVAVSPV
jgi:hypothetical protein